MVEDPNLVLDDKSVRQKIKRIAFQIYENNFSEKTIYLLGLDDNGLKLANLIHDELVKISDLSCELVRLDIDKSNVAKSEIKLDIDIKKLKGKVVVLVDDVINTASTLMYSMKALLHVQLKKIEVAVLVNRSHTRFPIAPNYTGYELSTTLEEHIDFVISDRELGVYLK